jgi:hypothetical protein
MQSSLIYYLIFNALYFRIVCAKCVLFGEHKSHDILEFEQACLYIRDVINNCEDKKQLKKEFCDSHLLEIREYQLRMDKYKNEAVKKINETFKDIINTLKQRMEELITEVDSKFVTEQGNISAQENKWKSKQNIANELLSFSQSTNDIDLLKNSKFIMEGIRSLNEPSAFREIKVYNDLDTTLDIDLNDFPHQTGSVLHLSIEDVKKLFRGFMYIGEPNALEYRA